MDARRRLTVVIAIATASLLAGACGGTKKADCAPPVPQEWTVDGTITSVATHCTTMFVAGSFEFIGASTGAAAVIDRVSGRSKQFPRVDGEVTSAAADGRGGWFVGGSFAHVAGRPCRSLAHVEHGRLDWCAAGLEDVRQLAAAGDRLYVATGSAYVFACCGRLLAFDRHTPRTPLWQLRLPPRNVCRVSGNCADVSRVDALAAGGGTVYAGGVFGTVGGKSSNDLVALDGRSGRVLDWNAGLTNDRKLIPSTTDVGALALAGRTLYVGGSFTGIGGAARAGVAAIDTSTARATAWNPHLRLHVRDLDNEDPWVFGLAATSSRVFVSGFFNASVMALDATTGAALRWRPSLRYGEYDAWPVAATGRNVYVLGRTKAGGAPLYVSAIDMRTGQATRWRPRTNGYVSAVAFSGTNVLIGGAFSSVNPIPRSGLAAIDGAHGRLLPWHPVLRMKADLTPVRALLATDRTLYVGGAFFRVDGRKRRGLAAFDLPSLRLTAWQPRLNGDPYSHVKALALVGDTLSMGGDFNALNGRARQAFGAVSATSGDTVGVPSFHDDYSGQIMTLHADGDTVYAGGVFSTDGPGLVAFDGRSGALTSWTPAIGGSEGPMVLALATGGGGLYVGGFDVAGSAPLALVDIHDGHLLPFHPRFVGIYYRPGSVDSILVGRAGLYIAGPFKSVDGKPRNGIALLDPETARVKPWTLASCKTPAGDPDADNNSARVLVAVGSSIVTNCRAFGDGERLVVTRAPG